MLNRVWWELNSMFEVRHIRMKMKTMSTMNWKRLAKNSRRKVERKWLGESASMERWVDWMLNLRNDERSMRHNTSHVPNQAILMNTFLRRPEKKYSMLFILMIIRSSVSYQDGNNSNTTGDVKRNLKTFFLKKNRTMRIRSYSIIRIYF